MEDMIGTIISSALNYDQLNMSLRQPRGCDPARSVYAPCDGRSIAGSLLCSITGQTKTPDLRGAFIRGLNSFHLEGQPGVVPEKMDPDGLSRTFGSFQYDAVIAHSHPATVQLNGSITGSNRSRDVEEGGEKYNSDPTFFGGISVTIENNENGKAETRPKNVAVYFYIKIN